MRPTARYPIANSSPRSRGHDVRRRPRWRARTASQGARSSPKSGRAEVQGRETRRETHSSRGSASGCSTPVSRLTCDAATVPSCDDTMMGQDALAEKRAADGIENQMDRSSSSVPTHLTFAARGSEGRGGHVAPAFSQANLRRVGDLNLPAADSLAVDGRRSVADPLRAVVVFDLSRLTPADPYRVFLALVPLQALILG
jgi:hypothetical protein